VGKLAAKQAYQKARHLATSEELLAGVEAYKYAKPGYADWCHPATWLRQGRWMDEPDAKPTTRYQRTCPHVPTCRTTGACCHRQDMERRV
jgi:hypothetical protein